MKCRCIDPEVLAAGQEIDRALRPVIDDVLARLGKTREELHAEMRASPKRNPHITQYFDAEGKSHYPEIQGPPCPVVTNPKLIHSVHSDEDCLLAALRRGTWVEPSPPESDR